ncbi:MAG: MarR family winged helix-turn-helix transcriptional regulator [Parvibaculaceae bacterium]
MELLELIFFAYRDFTSDPDVILETFGFGRAHHRVIHFVGRHPGMRVAELLDILRITKQSLARVLKELVDRGFIVQRTGEADRRQRLLFLTRQGGDLHQRLMAPQMERIRAALQGGGNDVREVLFKLIDAEDREHVLALLDAASARQARRAP